MASKLTPAAIDRIKKPAKRVEVPDGFMPGLYLVVQPSGAKSWAVRTRINRRPVKFTLGGYPAVSLKAAHKLASEALIKAENGVDPLAERRERQRKAAASAGDTFQAIAEEYMRREEKRVRTMGDRRALLERLVFPVLGARPVEAISRVEIVRLLDRIEDTSGARSADLALAYTRKILNWHALRSDTFKSPVVRGMARHATEARSRILSDDELKRVWDAAGDGRPFAAAVRLLLLTAARRSEVSRMTWDEVAGGVWTLPGTRSKTGLEVTRPLSRMALALLGNVPRVEGCKFVFSNDGVRPVSSFGGYKAALDKSSGVIGWRVHDLRRTSRSLMSRAGISADISEMLLGHVLPHIRGIYDRYAYLEEKRRAYEQLAALIHSIVEPQVNVVPIRR
jgi:integrase